MDGTQFKIFLKMVHGCIELKNDLSFFNGADFLVFIPTKILQERDDLINGDMVPLPKSEQQAKAMILLAEHYLNNR